MKKLLLLSAIILFTGSLFAQYTWTQKANFPGTTQQWQTSFVINKKGYLVGGKTNTGAPTKELWEYDPDSDTWTQKANFVGEARSYSANAPVNGKGYVLWGFNNQTTFYNDTWEYDPNTNNWTQKNASPGVGRASAVAFVLDNKIYAGTGLNGSSGLKDFYQYDPGTDTWSQKNDFGGDNRRVASGFVLNGFGYLGLGASGIGNTVWHNDWWQYNHNTDTWTQKANFPGQGTGNSSYFALNGEGHIVGGWRNFSDVYDEHYVYNPNNDTWTQLSNFSGTERWGAGTIGFDDRAYIITGAVDNNNTFLSDVWEYSNPSGINSSDVNSLSLRVFPIPSHNGNISILFGKTIEEDAQIVIYDVSGKLILIEPIKAFTQQHDIDLSAESNGLYYYEITVGDRRSTGKFQLMK